jgi:hypothetical protein
MKRKTIITVFLSSALFFAWVSYNNTTKCDDIIRSNVEALTDDAEYYIYKMKLVRDDIVSQDVSQVVRKAGLTVGHDTITGIYSYSVGVDGTVTYTATNQIRCTKYYCDNSRHKKDKCDTREEGIFTINVISGKSAFFPKSMYQTGWNDLK